MGKKEIKKLEEGRVYRLIYSTEELLLYYKLMFDDDNDSWMFITEVRDKNKNQLSCNFVFHNSSTAYLLKNLFKLEEGRRQVSLVNKFK